MANELYVLVVDKTGKTIGAKGPFEENQQNEIYGAIEEFEQDYNLTSEYSGSLIPSGKVRVVRVVYEKEPTL